MSDPDKLVVAGAVLVLLGLSYVVAVAAFARAYLLPATAASLGAAALLLVRVPRRQE